MPGKVHVLSNMRRTIIPDDKFSEPGAISKELPDTPRRGKAPPVDSFSGETPDITFDDWLPALQRAAECNQWTDQETLIQLAGHLRGRALQEWDPTEDVREGEPRGRSQCFAGSSGPM